MACADVAKEVLDRCTREEGRLGSKEYTVEFDYQFVEDFQERRHIHMRSLGHHRYVGVRALRYLYISNYTEIVYNMQISVKDTTCIFEHKQGGSPCHHCLGYIIMT